MAGRGPFRGSLLLSASWRDRPENAWPSPRPTRRLIGAIAREHSRAAPGSTQAERPLFTWVEAAACVVALEQSGHSNAWLTVDHPPSAVESLAHARAPVVNRSVSPATSALM